MEYPVVTVSTFCWRQQCSPKRRPVTIRNISSRKREKERFSTAVLPLNLTCPLTIYYRCLPLDVHLLKSNKGRNVKIYWINFFFLKNYDVIRLFWPIFLIYWKLITYIFFFGIGVFDDACYMYCPSNAIPFSVFVLYVKKELLLCSLHAKAHNRR